MLGEGASLPGLTDCMRPAGFTEDAGAQVNKFFGTLVDQYFALGFVVARHIGPVDQVKCTHTGGFEGAHREAVLVVVDIQGRR